MAGVLWVGASEGRVRVDRVADGFHDVLVVIGGDSVLWRDEAVKTGLIIASNWRRQR